MRGAVDEMAAVMSTLNVFVIPEAGHATVLGTRFVREMLAFLSAHREDGQ